MPENNGSQRDTPGSSGFLGNAEKLRAPQENPPGRGRGW